jgi:hypothetical protein
MSEGPADRPADEVLAQWGAVNNLRHDAAQALLLLGEVRQLTGWPDELLCEQLDCDPARWVEVGGTPAKDPDALRHSLAFLALVRDVAQLVDLTSDCRGAVNGACELCADAGGPVADRVPRIRAALRRPGEDGYSAWDLLELGELGRAWRVAALNMDAGPVRERAQAAARLLAPISHLSAHLSADRLQLLAVRRDELLGVTVAARMRMHLRRCEKCRCFADQVAPGLVDDVLVDDRPAAA